MVRGKDKIIGVSILTIGPALGHGVEVDRVGLEMALKCLKARGSVKLTSKHDGEFDDICGKVANFRIVGDQIKGDVDLFATHPMRQKLVEIAEAMPEEFGLSIESFGEDEPRADGRGKWFRPSDIDAVALVPRPAANPRGLFGALVTRRKPATFTELVEQKKQSGSKNPFVAAVLTDPALYNAYRAAIEQPQEPSAAIKRKVEAELSRYLAAGSSNRPSAMLRLARENPDLYNQFRREGGI